VVRVRVATFNLENLGGGRDGKLPLSERLSTLRPGVVALHADILCLQEVDSDRERTLAALDELLAGTEYESFHRVSTVGPHGKPRDVHNLVTLSRYPVLAHRQVLHDYVEPLSYRYMRADPPQREPVDIVWDRPLLHLSIQVGERQLEVVNLHLRSPLPAPVPGQKRDAFSWKSSAAWAEGIFVAALKRDGQALEARLLVDELLDADEGALIAVCGDFNAPSASEPLAIVCAPVREIDDARLGRRSLIPVETALPHEKRFSVIHGGERVLLDHIVVSRGLLADFDGAMIHHGDGSDELVDYHLGREIPGSHHAAVTADFRFA